MSDIYVALLRGINVGIANRVAMGDLRALLIKLGYTRVRTVLNSGNAVFESDERDCARAARRLEQELAAVLGVTPRVTLLSASELSESAAPDPILKQADNPSRLLVAFPHASSDMRVLQDLAQRDWAPEAMVIRARSALLWCPAGVSQSALMRAVTAALGERVTARNWTTVQRIRALVDDV